MSWIPLSLRFPGRLVLSLLVLAGLPLGAFAETITITNDTKVALIVQAAIVVKGTVKRGAPVILLPGRSTAIILPGNKLISVYNSKLPNQVVHESTLPASKDDAAYVLQPDLLPGRAKLEKVKTPAPPDKKDKTPPDKKDKTPPPKKDKNSSDNKDKKDKDHNP